MVLSIIGTAASVARDSGRLQQLYARLGAVEVKHIGGEAPLIGITPTGSRMSSISRAYVDAVTRAGGVPVIIVADTSAQYLHDVVSRLDGVLLTGGEDIAPSYFGEVPIEQLGEVDSVRDVV